MNELEELLALAEPEPEIEPPEGLADELWPSVLDTYRRTRATERADASSPVIVRLGDHPSDAVGPRTARRAVVLVAAMLVLLVGVLSVLLVARDDRNDEVASGDAAEGPATVVPFQNVCASSAEALEGLDALDVDHARVAEAVTELAARSDEIRGLDAESATELERLASILRQASRQAGGGDLARARASVTQALELLSGLDPTSLGDAAACVTSA